MKNQLLLVEIWRGRETGFFQSYEVPRSSFQTILDVVTYIQRQLDSSLSYRFSCRVGMCGTCAMTVNGVPRWTCRTQASVFDKSERITIKPLENFPVVKDLVVDMEPFFKKWTEAGGSFQSSRTESDEFAEVLPGSSERQAADRSIECIGCGICYAVCDVVRWKPDYLGPAALNRVWSLINDERDAGHADRLTGVLSDSGCISCHTTRSCTQFCPKDLDPSNAIAGLKQKALRNNLW